MDRTDEMTKISELFRTDGTVKEREARELSAFMQQSLNVAVNMEGNDALVKKLERLTNQKEFSNDPTAAIQEISNTFERNVTSTKDQFNFLKRESENYREGKQSAQHRKYIIEFLSKTMSEHITAFKSALKVHGENVEARNKRVSKFGKTDSSLKFGAQAGAGAVDINKYALFGSSATSSEAGIQINRNTEMRNRRSNMLRQQEQSAQQEETINPSLARSNSNESLKSVDLDGSSHGKDHQSTSSPLNLSNHNQDPSLSKYDVFNSQFTHANSDGTVTSRHSHNNNAGNSKTNTTNKTINRVGGNSSSSSGAMQQQQQQYNPKVKDTSRMQNAQRVEASIAQMGKLFSQMASLVSEQSAIIQNIEDDVECGLTDTMEAHKSMEDYQNITKGNRAMIIKIFLLLFFFVLLFMLWT